MRRRGFLAGALLVASLTAGCGDDRAAVDAEPTAGARPVTSAESDRLAVTRFRNYERQVVPFEIEIASPEGQSIAITGRADMVEHRAVATVVQADPTLYGVFAWNLGAFASLTTQAPATEAELANAGSVPAKAWQVRPFEEDQPLDQVLRVLLNLGFERPDNSQLLRQNGATWKASTTVDGEAVDVMTATPDGATLTYYVTADDRAQLVRVDVAGDFARPATITFLPGEAAEVGAVPVVKALGAEPSGEPSELPLD